MINEMFNVSPIEAVMYVNKDRLDAYIDGFMDGIHFTVENKKTINPDTIVLFASKISDYLDELSKDKKEQGVMNE